MTALQLTHDAIDGTVVSGTERGDGSRSILRTYGMRWGRELGAWYLPNSRAAAAKAQTIDALAEALRAGGFTVDVDVQAVTVAEVEEARAQLAQSRETSLRARSERLTARAEGEHARAREILDIIPMGQPIVQGHHSEARHRRDLARAHGATDREMQARQDAQAATRAADAAAAAQAQRESLPSIGRRLDALQAEATSLARRLAELEDYPADDYRARLRAEAEQVSEQIAYWTTKRDEVIQQTGARAWSREDFVIGDRVRTAKGHTATVLRVNKKTLTVNYDVMPASITNPLRYYDVVDLLPAKMPVGRGPRVGSVA
ncbi:MAG: DUF3560 domain-containing protein [Vicinamibacterales bacterium]